MNQINFKVTFLTDIVLQASSNSEGKVDTLDFIPGSAFLGMVAKYYDEFENSFEIFHSGKVRFGEATPLLNGKPTYKIPLCFFSPKLRFDDQEIYNNHFIDYSDENILDKQLKQKREGYINSSLEYATIDYNYSQKSAYDTKLRRSKDEKMYGYKSMPKGLTWQFSIKHDKEIDIDKVVEKLIGIKYLGKSKTAQYGKVKIEKLQSDENQNIEKETSDNTTYVYVNSSLALFDELGNYTLTPTKENLGLTSGDIDWEKTQIRIKTFTPYNYKREGFDSSRLVIQRGSVIAIKDAKEDINTLKTGIGAFLSEGYGEVLINPEFLLKEREFQLSKGKFDLEFEEDEITQKDETLINFLTTKQKEQEKTYEFASDVQEFITNNHTKFEKVSKSQWGQIRMIVQFNQDGDYIEKIENFITKEDKDKKKRVYKKVWETYGKLLIDTLEKESLEFAKLLSIMMPKYKGEDNE